MCGRGPAVVEGRRNDAHRDDARQTSSAPSLRALRTSDRHAGLVFLENVHKLDLIKEIRVVVWEHLLDLVA